MPVITQTVAEASAGETPDSYQYQVTVESYFHHESTLAALIVDQLVAVTYAFANVKSIYLYAAADTTIKTDSTGSPEQSFTLYAGQPVTWNYGMRGVVTNPLTSNIALGWYVSCVAGGAFKMRLGYDVP